MPRLRPALLEFAEFQEYVLRENDHKNGWQHMDISTLFDHIEEEVYELRNALLNNADNVDYECADVANFCMFLAHVWRNKKDKNENTK